MAFEYGPPSSLSMKLAYFQPGLASLPSVMKYINKRKSTCDSSIVQSSVGPPIIFVDLLLASKTFLLSTFATPGSLCVLLSDTTKIRTHSSSTARHMLTLTTQLSEHDSMNLTAMDLEAAVSRRASPHEINVDRQTKDWL